LPNVVLDSFAVLAFLFGESGHQKVVTALEKAADTDSDLLIAAPNWAEVRYIVERKVGSAKWREVRSQLLGLPIEIVSAGQELSELAGELKVTKKMSLADCFAAALAKRENAQVYTGDPEFKKVEHLAHIVWIT